MIPVALAAGAILYSVWLVELFVDTGVHAAHAYTSELAAFDQPYGWILRTCDLVAGILVAAAATSAATRVPRRRPGSRVGWWALAVFGVATVVDSQWSLSCSPSSNDACAAAEAAGTVPLTHQLHSVSSATASTAAVVSAVALSSTMRTSRVLAWSVTAVLVLATGWTLLAVFTGATVGIAQRVQLLAFASWLTVLASATARAKRECFT